LDEGAAPVAMHPKFREIVESLDGAKILDARRRNLKRLREALAPLFEDGTLRLMTDAPEKSGLYLPVLVKNRDAVKRELIARKLFCPAAIWPDQQPGFQARYDAFFKPVTEWAAGKVLFFEGNPKNVLSESGILDKALYIIIPCLSEQTVTGFNYAVNKVLAPGVPADKFVIGVTTIDVTDEAATDGYFSGGETAIVGAARWAVEPAGNFGKKGICVDHAQFDYYNIQHVYSEIGQAISIMNPSPVK
jgi:hypothetical protein